MTADDFDAPLFIRDGEKTSVDLSVTPFFCNLRGRPVFAEMMPTGVVELEPETSDSQAAFGREYAVIAMPTEKPDPKHGEQTELKFFVDEVVYQPMEATRCAAAAFGMTLVEKGQGIRVCSPVMELEKVEYEYGMFAGHWSPYKKREPGHRLLGVVGTDLECHNFPHVFVSVDPFLPLVISVARFWPALNKIYLADLWLPKGNALYVPPRAPQLLDPYLNLHGNRNSALACWRGSGQTSVMTQTLLQTNGGYFHWFWNNSPSIHPLLGEKSAI